MKRILVVLALVLCMALPASAEITKTVDTSKDLRDAVDDSSVERIIISGDIHLPANISITASTVAGEEPYLCGLSIDRSLTVQINEGCTLFIDGETNAAHCTTGIISNKSLTIAGQGSICVTNSCTCENEQISVGVGAYNAGVVNIADGVKISAIGEVGDGCCAVGVSGAGAQANILNAALSGDLYEDDECGGTIKVYGGKFTSDPSDYLGSGREVTAINEPPYRYKVTNTTSSSSGGCNAGFGAAALTTLAATAVVRRRKK